MFCSMTNVLFQISWATGDHFNIKFMHAIYWAIWLVYTGLLIYSSKFKKPWLMRIILHLVVARNLLPYMSFEKRKYDDFLKMLLFILMQMPYMMLLEICVCLVETVYISVFYVLAVDFVINWRVVVMIAEWLQKNDPQN